MIHIFCGFRSIKRYETCPKVSVTIRLNKSLENMVTRKLLTTVITIPLVLPKAKKVGEENDGQD